MAAQASSYKSSGNVVHSCKYHVVWCPKSRRDVLKDGADARLKAIIREVCVEYEAELLEMEVMPDRVHLLVEVAPQVGIARLVARIKGRSSRLLRSEFRWCRTRVPTLWTRSYFVTTVGGAPLEVVRRYIEQQKHV